MKNNKTVMIALGGNALSPKNESGTIKQQFAHTKKSLKSVMHFVKAGYNICITHGNGPQVGAELSRNEIASKSVPPLPLGVLVANTQGAMGYMIQQSLQNALYNVDSEREVVSFISQKIMRKFLLFISLQHLRYREKYNFGIFLTKVRTEMGKII